MKTETILRNSERDDERVIWAWVLTVVLFLAVVGLFARLLPPSVVGWKRVSASLAGASIWPFLLHWQKRRALRQASRGWRFISPVIAGGTTVLSSAVSVNSGAHAANDHLVSVMYFIGLLVGCCTTLAYSSVINETALPNRLGRRRGLVIPITDRVR